jgi:hypothetical protein
MPMAEALEILLLMRQREHCVTVWSGALGMEAGDPGFSPGSSPAWLCSFGQSLHISQPQFPEV